MSIDRETGGAIGIDASHVMIHQGRSFHASHIYSAIAAAASAELLIQTGSSAEGHLTVRIGATGQSEVELFEASTFSAAGTAITVRNRKRSKGDGAEDLTVTHTPTITGAGNRIEGAVIPGGSGNFASGGSASARLEWELNENTNYLVRITNTSASAEDISIGVNWYEVP
jgi:hypothetical protein